MEWLVKSRVFAASRLGMINKVDYFGYTLQRVVDADGHIPEYDIWDISRVKQALLYEGPEYLRNLPGEFTVGPGRKGFQAGFAIGNHTYIWGSKRGVVLIEHTGAGCELLQSAGILSTVMSEYAHRATRVDVASDILTEVMPADFVLKVSQTSGTTASGHQSSKTGETYYVGSRKSDRTCKVYRYFPPHPRAGFLRIEYTYRRKQAKVVAALLKLGKTADDIAIASGKRYGWQHECYQPEQSTDLEIQAWRPERRSGKTVNWLYSQCVPAVVRLVREGVLDLDEFIDHLRSKTDGNHLPQTR